jgi:NitT/TauT family transport system substrate-binding protein
MAGAITSGTVDAVVTYPPYSDQTIAQIGNEAVTWPAQSNQFGYGLLFCQNSWIAQNPGLIVRFLKSLSEAETYLLNNPQSSKAIVQEKTNETSAEINEAWSQNEFSLSLDQSLILAMQDESQWLMQNNLTAVTAAPNFLNYMYTNGLESADPTAVNIIG